MSLLSDVSGYIRSGESLSQKLGLEIEHFIVNDRGIQIDFHEISTLIKNTAEKINAKIVYMDGYPVGYIADKYTTSLEPACQFEISINPYSDIDEIGRIYSEFINLWEPSFKERGYHIITKGNLPLVELGIITPDDIPLSPKKRYIFMDNYFSTSGKYGKYMMRASGSAQISVDYSSEKDMVRKLRVLQKISPLLMIIMENKTDPDSALSGAKDKPHLFRIQQWDDIDPDRTGFVPHSFDEDFGYDKMAEVICNVPLILYTEDGVTEDVGSKTALDLVNDGRNPGNIEHIMSMGFFHFRVKKYIEIRVADAVPIPKALGYVALIKGIVYSDSALTLLEKELETVGGIPQIQQAVESIEREGFDAVIYNGKTAREWADHIIGIASGNLPEEEKEYLDHVRAFRSNGKEKTDGQRYA